MVPSGRIVGVVGTVGVVLAAGLETRVVTTVPGLMVFTPMTLTATVAMPTAVTARTARDLMPLKATC